ncbi:MAG: TolC family outer membrane protein [Oceanospirillaceae bacterium]|nr:TolC family outer membrane protein [Oceanospirillaceae bacterium]
MAVSIFSTSVQSADLLGVYQQAQESDPIYQAGFHQHQASIEIYQQAKAVLLPNIKLSYNRTDTTQDIVSSDNAVFNAGSTSFPTTALNLSITQSIYSFSNWAYFKQAKEEVKRVAAELEEVNQSLIFRVAEAYFSVLGEQDNFVAIAAEASALEKHFELVSNQRSSGLARMTDFLDAQARFLQAQARKVEIANDLQDAIQGLREMTGILPDNLIALGNELQLVKPDPYVADNWLHLAAQQNPLVLAKRSAVAVSLQEVRRQRGGHYPTLDLTMTQNNQETEGSLFGGGSEVDTRTMMFTLTVPIYAGGAVVSKVRETLNLQYKAQDELEQTLRANARETRAAFNGVVGSISKVRALKKSLEAYELAVEAKRTSYQSGLESGVSVLDAERDLFIARSDFSSARYGYLLNILSLKRAAGTLSLVDLEGVNTYLQGDAVPTDVQDIFSQIEELSF